MPAPVLPACMLQRRQQQQQQQQQAHHWRFRWLCAGLVLTLFAGSLPTCNSQESGGVANDSGRSRWRRFALGSMLRTQMGAVEPGWDRVDGPWCLVEGQSCTDQFGISGCCPGLSCSSRSFAGTVRGFKRQYSWDRSGCQGGPSSCVCVRANQVRNKGAQIWYRK